MENYFRMPNIPPPISNSSECNHESSDSDYVDEEEVSIGEQRY